jgi:hypothetical protein
MTMFDENGKRIPPKPQESTKEKPEAKTKDGTGSK